MPLRIRDIVQPDYPVVAEVLELSGLADGMFYDPEGLEVLVAELDGSVVGVAEFQRHCDFGHDEGREAYPGKQTFIWTMAVTPAARRSGAGRALLGEIARRTQDSGLTFLALVPQDGDNAAGRQAFFHACGLRLYGPGGPGAAWGCPVSEFLAAKSATSAEGR
ncbi:N-acetyltransferase family protein [Streptomyces goshikiensis]